MPDNPHPQTLWQTFIQQTKGKIQTAARAVDWFKKNVELLKTVHGNVLMSSDRQRLVSLQGLSAKHTGRMIMFFYDPKLKKKLPYYDRFPLVLPVRFYNNGFLGLNLHYLPIPIRAKLLDRIYTRYMSRQFDENQKLSLDYHDLNTIVEQTPKSNWRFFRPCVKRYLYGHCRSRFYLIDPAEWNMMLMLPTERFEKKGKDYVWRESKQKLGIRN